MKTIINDSVITQIINKSTFIAYLKKTTTIDEAKKYINEVKTLHPNATHHVTCYLIGNTAELGHCNDDGEPSGTAGLPILDVFKKNNVTNFVCIVVRYFGGIKLGAGGLIRAYSSTASLALKEAKTTEIISYSKVNLTFKYNYLNAIEKILKEFEIINKFFTTNVVIEVMIPFNILKDITNSLISLTNNQIDIEIVN